MWFMRLKKHHEFLCLRKPEATSLTRCTSFNCESGKALSENLKELMPRHNLTADNICNLDETGNSTIHSPKLSVLRESSKWGVTSGKRGINVTTAVAVYAIGNHDAPILMFPRLHLKNHTLIHTHTDSIGSAYPTGWSNERPFTDYLKHFITH